MRRHGIVLRAIITRATMPDYPRLAGNRPLNAHSHLHTGMEKGEPASEQNSGDEPKALASANGALWGVIVTLVVLSTGALFYATLTCHNNQLDGLRLVSRRVGFRTNFG